MWRLRRGAEVPLLPLNLPDKLRGIARERVGQRMLVDRLAVPLDDLEVRPFAAKGRAGQWTHAVVADAKRLAGWRDALPAGCIALLPDYMALPCAPEVWTVQVRSDAVLARLGLDDGFSAEPELAEVLLAEAADAGVPKAVLVLGEPSATLQAVLDRLDVPVFNDLEALVKAGHPKPLRWADAARGIDLKDPPSATFDRLRDQVRAWRLPVVFAVLALAAFLGSVALETRRLQDQSAGDQATARDLVRQYFVPTGPILDMRAQVTAAVAAAAQPEAADAADADPLILFQSAAPLLDRDSVSLQAVGYRADTGLVISANVSDFSELDTLVADLRDGGFLVELLDSSARQSGGVAARMRLIGAQG